VTDSSDARDVRIDQLFARLSENPTEVETFEELERELRAAGRFLHLAGAYEVRLQSVHETRERAAMLLDLGKILRGPLNAPKAALKRLKDARGLDPQSADILSELRRLLVDLGDTMAALQISEDEERLDLAPSARAKMLCETAALWETLGEQNQVRKRLEEALRICPDHADARAAWAL